jgi:hypothetical protein
MFGYCWRIADGGGAVAQVSIRDDLQVGALRRVVGASEQTPSDLGVAGAGLGFDDENEARALCAGASRHAVPTTEVGFAVRRRGRRRGNVMTAPGLVALGVAAGLATGRISARQE